MKTTSLFVGICLAVGMGHAAQAATYRYDLKFLETIYRDADIEVYNNGQSEYFQFPSLSSKDDVWGLPLLWSGIEHGETYRFEAEVYDGHVASCRLGTYDCSIWNDEYWSYAQTDPLEFWDEETWVHVTGRGQAGDTLAVWKNWYFFNDAQPNDAGFYAQTGDRSHNFLIERVVPVPLPFSATLLSLGLGAFALTRVRRQTSQ